MEEKKHSKHNHEKKEDDQKSKDKDHKHHHSHHDHHSHHSHKSHSDKSSKKSYAGVLSDTDITREVKEGNVVIYPFLKSSLHSCSYDVSLGATYFRANPKAEVLNPFVPEHVLNYWGMPQMAEKASKEEAAMYGLKHGDQFIRLDAGETILAHTNEFIGGQLNITTKMQARSSMGRSNLTVCRCAGQGDVGYINRWCMQISNMNHCTVVLPVGAKVAQIVFYYCASTPSAPYVGKYQKGNELEALTSSWKAEDMLPKAQMGTDVIKPTQTKAVPAPVVKPTAVQQTPSVFEQLANNKKLVMEN